MSVHLPRRRSLVALALALAGAALAYASFVRVPVGQIAVVGRPGGSAAITPGPGWRLMNPFSQRAVLIAAGPIQVEGTAQWLSPEGATLRRKYRFTLDAGRGDPEVLLREAADGDLPAASRRALEAAVVGGTPPVEVGLETRLGAYGLVPGSLSLESAVAEGETGANPIERLKASWRGPAHPVLVIGIDSADWSVMDPMIERGDLPAFAKLRESGAWASLRSMKPALSPLLWTTVATGKRPEEHGIVDFLTRDPASGKELPITSRHRRVKALWSILTDLGQPSLTVGWWATWPAEHVDGVMITDRVSYSLFADGAEPRLRNAIYPEDAARELAPLVVRPQDIRYEDLLEIVDVPAKKYERARASLEQASSYSDPVAHLLRILAATRTYHRMALKEIRSSQPPLSLVYYEGLDEVNHRFAQCAPPAMKTWCDDKQAAAYGHAVENFYKLQDKLVSDLVGAVAKGTTVMVVSDHGFAWGDARPTDVPPDIEGKPGRWHTLAGVLIAAGPSIKPGRLAEDPSLLDITPTILALLSLPEAQDMPGQAISAVAGPVSASVATYETPGRESAPETDASSSPADAEMLAKLTALGYIGGSAETPAAGSPVPAPPGTAAGTVTGHLNTANALLAQGKYDAAEPEYRAALEIAPRYFPARLGLAQCLVATGRADEGFKDIDAAMMDADSLDAGIYMKVARYLRHEGRAKEGADLFSRLPKRPGLEAARLSARGILLAAAGSEAESEAALRQSLGLDPAQSEALQGMYDILSRRGALDELASILERAVRARPGGIEAVNFLALTRERMGRVDEAKKLLTDQLARSPRDVPTLTNLAGVLMRQGEDKEALPLLQKVREVRPGDLNGIVNLIVLEGKLGDLAAAREAYRAAGERADTPPVLNAMGYACYVNGALDEAKRLLDRSLELAPDQKETRRLRRTIDASAGTASTSTGGPGL